jgi:WD40 repeat protein
LNSPQASVPPRTIKIWDAKGGAVLQTLKSKGYGAWAESVAFSKDGTRVASCSNDIITIWNAISGAELQTLEGHRKLVRSITFSQDGTRVASGSDDGTVKIWDAMNGAVLQTFEGHSFYVESIAFSQDGTRVASGSMKNIKIWDAKSGAVFQTLKGYGGWVNSVTGWVNSVAFSQDGRRVASSSEDMSIQIWDVKSGALLQTFKSHRIIRSISFDDASSNLLTDMGTISLGMQVGSNIVQSAFEEFQPSYGLSIDRAWITLNGRNVLWLPPSYRPVHSAFMLCAVAISGNLGRVLTFEFSSKKSLLQQVLLQTGGL